VRVVLDSGEGGVGWECREAVLKLTIIMVRGKRIKEKKQKQRDGKKREGPPDPLSLIKDRGKRKGKMPQSRPDTDRVRRYKHGKQAWVRTHWEAALRNHGEKKL